jgi:hypothetical protein
MTDMANVDRTDAIRQRFVNRAVRLCHYRQWLMALGFGLTVFWWAAAADATVCRVVMILGRYRVVCGG